MKQYSKKYKAIFFDWDGTAVTSRTANPAAVLAAMQPLLLAGTKLIIISGTTMENICGGELESLLSPKALQNLYMGLARGNVDYGYSENGTQTIIHNATPQMPALIALHEVCFALHCLLLQDYGIKTDICFSRDNYCKIDLTVQNPRGNALFLQHGDLEALEALLKGHGCPHNLLGLTKLAEEIGEKHGINVRATTDAKYLEVGYTTKTDNVNRFMQRLSQEGITEDDCCFWGDEFGAFAPGLWGSDAQMITPLSQKGDFYSVSTLAMPLPSGVQDIGGSCDAFLNFLHSQAEK